MKWTPYSRKIIGARWYIKGYEAEFGKLKNSDGVEFLSPRDASGHGTHTSSTAAGAILENASYMGVAQGYARGGAPSAWLAIYKVCWSTGGCSSADILAAFDDAIFDGVDLLSVSIGSSPPLSSYVEDLLAIGSFHVVARGIPVICSSGNSGPNSQTVINYAPWMITVAASTMDRAFPTVITMGNNQTIVGHAIYTGEVDDKFYSIVYGEDIVSKDADEDDARVPKCNFSKRKSGFMLPISITKICNYCSKNYTESSGSWPHLFPVSGKGCIGIQQMTTDLNKVYKLKLKLFCFKF